MNEKILRKLCSKQSLKVIDFMESDKRDWCITDIAKKSKVSRTVVYKLIKLNILAESRGDLFRLNEI